MDTGWRTVTSNKPNRRGEVFILYGDLFVAKIYRDVHNNLKLSEYLCKQLNKCLPEGVPND